MWFTGWPAIGRVVLGSLAAFPHVALAQGLTAIAMVIAIQYVTMLISARAPSSREHVEGQPILLVFKGSKVADAVRRQNIGDIELLQALRQNGMTSVEETDAVVLEANGEFSGHQADRSR